MRGLHDCCVVRYRQKNQEWLYEVCHEDDLERYERTRDEYQMCSPKIREWSASFEFEILHSGIVYVGNKLVDHLGI